MKTNKTKYTSKTLANNLAKIISKDINDCDYYGIDWDDFFDKNATDKDIVNAPSKIDIKCLKQALIAEIKNAKLDRLVKAGNSLLKEIQDASKYNIRIELEMSEADKIAKTKYTKKQCFLNSLNAEQKKAYEEIRRNGY